MKQFFIDNLIAFITNIALAVGWLFDRKKLVTQTQILTEERNKDKIANDVSAMKLYQELLDDLKKRYDEKFVDLQTELNNFKKNYNLLKREFIEYKRNHS